MKKHRRKIFTQDNLDFTLLALPTVLWYVAFSYLPMFGGIIAFIDFKRNGGFIHSIFTSEWVGFKNFEFLFASRDIWLIMRNTLAYNIVFIILGIVLPVTAAIMLGQLYSQRKAKVYQTAMFLPYFLSWVVVSALVWAFLSYEKGLLNDIMRALGAEPKQWYMEKDIWPGLLIFLHVWKSLGYGTVVYLATITGLDPTYYEAALIDGATKWQQATRITIPLMKPVIIIMFILAVGGIFRSGFGMFYNVPRDSSSLHDVVYTIDVLVYKQLRTSTPGMASAAAMTQSVLGCITILTANAIVRKLDRSSALI